MARRNFRACGRGDACRNPQHTRDACVDALKAAVTTAVPTLETQPVKDERVTLTGSNADYHVTMLCGEAKGKMSAYISYRWLTSPG